MDYFVSLMASPIKQLLMVTAICSIMLVFLVLRSDRFRISYDMELFKSECPSVLHNMVDGEWVTRDLTKQEDKEINEFYRNAMFFVERNQSFQKPDGACGNVTYYPWMSKDPVAQWFRVLCDPKGTTPCCYNNRCEARSVSECKCDNCYDLRPLTHAEYAQWIPKDPRCSVKNFTSTEACRLLQGGNLHFYGDSLVRQMFLAMVILLKGDYSNGGLRPDAPQEAKTQCRGMYVFPTKNCRKYLDYKPNVCGGNVSIEFHHSAKNQEAPAMVKAARTIKNKPKTIVLFGCGSWTDFNLVDTVTYAYNLLTTLFPLEKSHQWPKVVWSSFHSLGIWRNPWQPTVTNKYSKLFNRELQRIMSLHNVPVFDTAPITVGVRTVDGIHYGPGINFLKAQIYLNYIEELKRKGVWV